MGRIREVPELGNMNIRNKIINNLDLVDDETIKFLSTIPSPSKIIEIEGGMGEISEHLSNLKNNVNLIGDQRLFFVYRNSVFPKSNVTNMNLNPNLIKPGSKVYYDYAIIHDEQYFNLAKSIAKYVYNVSSKEIYSEKELVNSVEEPIVITENKNAEPTAEEINTSNSIIYAEQTDKSDAMSGAVSVDIEPVVNLE